MKDAFSSHWHEKIVFLRQFVDMLNPFIGCQQNLSKNTIFIMEITWKVLYKSLSNSNSKVKKIINGHICYAKQNFEVKTIIMRHICIKTNFCVLGLEGTKFSFA